MPSVRFTPASYNHVTHHGQWRSHCSKQQHIICFPIKQSFTLLQSDVKGVLYFLFFWMRLPFCCRKLNWTDGQFKWARQVGCEACVVEIWCSDWSQIALTHHSLSKNDKEQQDLCNFIYNTDAFLCGWLPEIPWVEECLHFSTNIYL